MENFTKKDMEESLCVIASMISRSEKTQAKFAEGTSQHTLQRNRIKSLHIASSLIKKELVENDAAAFTKNDLADAPKPIASLISKSEKAQAKLAKGGWQHTMLGNNRKALCIALPLITKILEEN